MTQLMLFEAPSSSVPYAATADRAPRLSSGGSPTARRAPAARRAPTARRAPAADRRVAAERARRPERIAEPAAESSAACDPSAVTASTPLPQLGGSLPLYDPQRGELQHIGDLAQRVISRYEIVARRRAILLARGPRQAARA